MGGASERTKLALLQQLSSLLLMVAFAVVSARWLGASGKGELAIITTAGLVAGSILSLGTPQALTAWIAQDSMSVMRGVLLGTAVAVVLGVSLFVVGLMSEPDSVAFTLLWLSASTIVFEQVMTGISAGCGDLVPPLLSRWIGGGSQVLLVLGALMLGVTPDVPAAAVLYYLLALAGIGIAIGALLRRSYHRQVHDVSIESQIRPLLAFGIRAVPGQILSMSNYKFDILLLGVLATSVDVGTYSVAVSATLLVGVIPAALGQALTRSFGSDLEPTVRLRRGFQLALFAGLLTALVIALGSPLLVVPVFGAEFSSVTQLIVIMVPFTALFATVQVSFPYFYNRLHQPLIQSLVIGVTAAVDLILVVALAPKNGALGAAIASAAAYGIGFIVNAVMTARGAEMHVVRLLVPDADDVRWASSRVSQFFRRVGMT